MKELIDMIAVKEDYEAGFSIRMLAAKYGVPKSTVGSWVKKYSWQQKHKTRRSIRELREDTSDTLLDTPVSNIMDRRTVSETEPLTIDEDYSMIRGYTQKLLKKADDLLDLDDALAPRDLKSLSSMLLDVRTLLNILSPREAAEQEMRIAAMKRQAQEEQKTSAEVTVRFVDTEADDASS